jgi:hypothetical protein
VVWFRRSCRQELERVGFTSLLLASTRRTPF